MIGGTVGAVIPKLGGPTKIVSVRLHGVEAGGVWIESQTMTDLLLQTFKLQAASKTPIFFVPYHEITFLLTSIDVPALNETSLHG